MPLILGHFVFLVGYKSIAMKKYLLVACTVLLFLPKYAGAQGVISTIAGNGLSEFIGDGSPADSFAFYSPKSICLDKQGDLYIADYGNMRIRKLDKAGVLSTVSGNGSEGYTGDNGPASAATLRFPDGVCIDTAGNIYITEWYNDVVRKIDAVTHYITTVCGSGSGGFAGDGGTATSANMETPGSACTDKFGNIYIPDYGNQRIRMVDAATGEITTYAGTGDNGYTGDGGSATNAKLSYPNYTCTDTAGNLYFTETGNNTIRKVDYATKMITSIAGTGHYGYTGDGGAATNAQLNQPTGVFVDKRNTIYFADKNNNVIRAISALGIISTIVGTGAFGNSGDGGPATSATMYWPTSVCVDDSGYIFIVDGFNSVIRKVTPLPSAVIDVTLNHWSIYPNPSNGKFVVRTNGLFSNSKISVCNSLGQVIVEKSFTTYEPEYKLDIANQPVGVYFVRYINEQMNEVAKIVVR